MSDALARGEVDLWLSSGDTKQVRRKFSLNPRSQDSRDAPCPRPRANLCSGTLCLSLFVCFWFTVSWCTVCRACKKDTKAHSTRQLHSIHMKKHKGKHIRSFFLSARSRSAVAVEVGLPETGSSSGFVLATRNRLERMSHCRQRPASHHRGCG